MAAVGPRLGPAVASNRIHRVTSAPALAAVLLVCGPGSLVALGTSGCSSDAAAATADASEPTDPETTKAIVAAVDSLVGSGSGGTAIGVHYDPRESLAPMIERVGPSVVSVHAQGHREAARAFSMGPGGLHLPEAAPAVSHGSGFVYGDDGLVVTNHHVVDGAEALTVRTHDGRELPAHLVGSDPLTDLALVQIDDKTALPKATLGDSKAARVGDWVVAIGSPLGLEHSASVGIVSAKGRGSLGLYRESYLDFLQTDADIAPGSSGGPLFDLQGRVVGINTAVGPGAAPGFAIPIDQAKSIIPKLQAHGRVVRGWLGAASDERDAKGGAKVGRVYEGTPAASGGLREGDVIRRVDGTAVVDFADLRARIAELEPGHVAKLEVDRGGSTIELSVTLAERPAADRLDDLRRVDPGAAPVAPAPSAPSSELRLGVQVRPLDDGLQIAEIEPDSLADRLGLQRGDVLRSVNGKQVEDPADVVDALRDNHERLSVDVLREGSIVTLGMRLSS